MRNRFILGALATVFLCLTFSHFTNASTASLKELEDIVEVVKSENLSIDKWEMIAKENIRSEKVEEKREQIASNFPAFGFQRKETEKVIKYVASNHHKKHGTLESIIIIVPKNRDQFSEIIYDISGSTWNEKLVERYSSKLAQLENNIFTENLTKFSCVTTTKNGKMKAANFFEKVVKKFNVRPLTNIEENDFVTLSGYTDSWEQSIPGEDHPINIQLAAREGLGGQTTITIGTPIITTEY